MFLNICIHTVLPHWMTNGHCFFCCCWSVHKPFWFHLDDGSILWGQPVGFNQELDLFCSIPVINWLIISGLASLNYGADCKMNMAIQWIGSDLHDVEHLSQISCHVWSPPTLCCWLPGWRWRNLPLPGPLYHTYIILLETQGKLGFMSYNYMLLKVIICIFKILIYVFRKINYVS